MRILIASDKFKGSLTAIKVGEAVEKGILNFSPKSEITKIPLADGGEGSLEALENTLQFEKKYLKVQNPLFQPIETFYGLKGSTAYIEMASASGLQLLREDQSNPMFTTSYGTGELIIDAVRHGVERIFLFIGGSATNDAGIGIASALGYNFKDENNDLLEPVGKSLTKIKIIDGNNSLKLNGIEVIVLTDVLNPLYGKNGAAHVFASQKGANELEIGELDNGLRNFAQVVKENFGKDISEIPGAGAAGGVGAGAIVFCNAQIKSGIDTILDILNIDEVINKSDFIITGEGLLDNQTLEGKVVKGVMDRCEKLQKPVGILCGDTTLTEKELQQINCSLIKSIKIGDITKEEAIRNAYDYLVKRSEELFKEFIDSST